MARTDILEKVKEFSGSSTVADLIDGFRELKISGIENSQLEGTAEFLFGIYKKDIDFSNLDQVIKYLEELQSQYPIETIEDIEEIENRRNVEIEEKPEIVTEAKSDLNKMKIDDLVDAYEKATNEKEKEKFKLEVERRENKPINEVERAIRTQQEIVREQAVLRDLDLERLNEKKEIERIEKAENVSKEQARIVLDEAKIAQAKLKVDTFADKIADDSEYPEYKNLIKNEIHQVIAGEKSKLEFPSAIDAIKAKTLEKQTNDFIKNNPEAVRQNFLGQIKDEFSVAKANAETEQELMDVEAYEKLLIKFHNVKGPQILMDSSRKDAENALQTEQKMGPGEIKNGIYNADAALKAVQHSPAEFGKMVDQAKNLANVSRKLFPNSAVVRSLDNLMANAAKNPIVINMQRMANAKVEFVSLATKIPGVNTLLVGAGEIAGFAATKDFILLATQVMKDKGIMSGTVAIFKAVTTGAGVLVDEAAVDGITTLSGMLGAFQGIPLVGQILIVVAMVIVAGMWIVDHIIKPLYNSVNNFLKNNLNLNLGGIRDFFANDLNLGGFLGGVAQAGVTGFMFLGAVSIGFMSFLARQFAFITVPITGIIIGLVSVFSFLGIVTNGMISSLVPPPPAVGGGNCVLKTVAANEGLINCNQNAPENNVSGMSRANFVGIAGRWSQGKNYSEECYNDVVNKALCAGVNPNYALWVWLHESGASNYSIKDVNDFGIAGYPGVAPKDFNAQLDHLLGLDPASACLGKNGITDYWVAFSTNFLLGTDVNDPINNGCDPNEESSGTTGAKYAESLKKTWSDMGFGTLPSNIKVDKGGQNCGGGNSATDTAITREYTDEKGQDWVCYGGDGGNGNNDGTPPNFEPWDPSIPVPEGCPNMIPAAGGFTQGPFAEKCSHQSMSVPAIDIGSPVGTPIYATHPGVASLNYDSIYGYYIDVHGKCDGKDFYTRYAHMPADGYRVKNNSTVKAGQQIGVVDDTGSSSGNHLHYHISGLDKNKFGQYLKLSVEQTKQLWGCCGTWNGKMCP